MASYRAFDIETVPDYTVWTPPPRKWGLVPHPESSGYPLHPGMGQTWPAYVTSEPEAFPPPQAQRVVAISWVDLSGDDDAWYFHENSESYCLWDHRDPDALEAVLLVKFLAAQNDDRANIVTWNGRQFDLPVINLRALKHKLQMEWYYAERDVRYRYSELGHIDLMDWFSDYGAAKNMKLGDVARLIGLPGKTGEVSGDNVAGFYARGDSREDMDAVANYCLSDSLQTALLFIRSRYHKGMISAQHHNRAIDSFTLSTKFAKCMPHDFSFESLKV